MAKGKPRWRGDTVICQLCGKPMKSLGLTGRAPKKNCSPAAWKKFEAFVRVGNFHPKGCR